MKLKEKIEANIERMAEGEILQCPSCYEKAFKYHWPDCEINESPVIACCKCSANYMLPYDIDHLTEDIEKAGPKGITEKHDYYEVSIQENLNDGKND